MVAKIRNFRLNRRGITVLTLVALAVAMLVSWSMFNLNPLMISMAEAKGRQLAVEAINKAVREVMGSGITYGDLMKVQTDGNGRVTLLQANTLLMNELATQAALTAQRNLGALGNEGVELPLGSALGINLFSGSGPKFRVSVVPVGSVTTRFATSFESAGINQTRHEISLEASLLMRIVIPTGADTVQVVAQVPVAESIIVGQVPETFVNVPDTDSMLNMVP